MPEVRPKVLYRFIMGGGGDRAWRRGIPAETGTNLWQNLHDGRGTAEG